MIPHTAEDEGEEESAIPHPAVLRRSLTEGLHSVARIDGPAARAAVDMADSAFDREEAVIRAKALLERARRASTTQPQ